MKIKVNLHRNRHYLIFTGWYSGNRARLENTLTPRWRECLAAGNHNSNAQSYTYVLIIPSNHEATFLRPAFLSSLVDDT
ncbi:hypothetical protein ALC57_00790 [Trachymyrmex cornetzi]|uniref:Uncharacterized protein n=1 Tax=Trachymyrmex cornetzi TaxID=471704 RepID=A0A151JRD3_9HYME|nr:hypothetical protein ALC57_00790 [Trachymyrmex cornetzi]